MSRCSRRKGKTKTLCEVRPAGGDQWQLAWGPLWDSNSGSRGSGTVLHTPRHSSRVATSLLVCQVPGWRSDTSVGGTVRKRDMDLGAAQKTSMSQAVRKSPTAGNRASSNSYLRRLSANLLVGEAQLPVQQGGSAGPPPSLAVPPWVPLRWIWMLASRDREPWADCRARGVTRASKVVMSMSSMNAKNRSPWRTWACRWRRAACWPSA